MYFEVSNTPENVRKKSKIVDEEEAVLKLAPFSATPIITFDNVLINVECTKILKIFNPKSEGSQILISKRPDDPDLKFSWYENYIESNETISLTLSWCPQSPISQRFTMQICDKSKKKYDVVIVCKSIKKSIQKTGKVKTKVIGVGRRSPKNSNSKTKIKPGFILNSMSKNENDFKVLNSHSNNIPKSSTMFAFSEYEEISNPRRDTYCIKKKIDQNQDTFLTNDFEKENNSLLQETPQNISKSLMSRQRSQFGKFLSSIENVQFSPLKNYNMIINDKTQDDKCVKEEKFYSKTKQDDSIEILSYNTHSNNIIISPTIEFSPFNFKKPCETSDFETFNIDDFTPFKNQVNQNNINLTHPINETTDEHSLIKLDHCVIQGYRNTEITTITIQESLDNIQTPCNKNQFDDCALDFDPKRCSTEKKSFGNSFNRDGSFGNLNVGSETFTKADSPIVPLNPDKDMHSSPYSIDESSMTFPVKFVDKYIHPEAPVNDNMKNFKEMYILRNLNKEKNQGNSAKSIIEANMWTKSPPLIPTQLHTISEEPSIICSEVSLSDINRKINSETFILNKTYETNNPPMQKFNIQPTKTWNKTAVRKDRVVHKIFDLTKENSTINAEKSSHTLDIYAIATTADPFLATTCLYDKDAFDKLETEFKHWLNYLLTPPADLETKMDIGKVWIENRNKNVPVAPTVEQVSSKYHTSHRLECLRRKAKALIKTPEIHKVFLNVTSQIEREILSIRKDKNLLYDVGLQKYVLSLLLSYNPLWLRIGLEALYDKPIPLSSNDDFGGLSDFIKDHMFKEPYQKKNLVSSEYEMKNLKKFTLKKFLFLVYFLDQAKKNKIIPHDPCLFCRNVQFKESREILFQFSKELLSGVGDITKHLRPTGYIVSHKQTHINEFKYAVHNLATDLQDGIRLTRLMEIILLKENLTLGLRMPAISRLQKKHNVQLALSALESANFKIIGDITAWDIVNGHREKTLSFLWQLIHKFRAPLFENASIIIQKWWKKKYLKISVEKRIKERKLQRFHRAATTVQCWWRNIQRKKEFLIKLSNETKASIVIQKNWKMWKCKSTYDNVKKSTIFLQRVYRNYRLKREARIHLEYLRKNKAAIEIQQWYRKMKIRKMLKFQNRDHEYFSQLKLSTVKIQNLYRAKLAMKHDRSVFVKIKTSTVTIQRFYRSVVKTRILRQQFLILKATTIYIQTRFRANLCMKMCKNSYEIQRNAAMTLQRFYRNYNIMKKCRQDYLKTRNAAILIQKFYKNRLLTAKLQNAFVMQKWSAIVIQRYFRSYCKKKEDRSLYLLKKNAVVLIQRRFRDYLIMKNQRKQYLALKEATIVVQKYYRSIKLMEKFKLCYSNQRNAVIVIQRMFRSYVIMKKQRQEFLNLKKATICIQNLYRAKKLMINDKLQYNNKRNAALTIQRKFRSYILMKHHRQQFVCLKEATITIQKYYRAKKHMEKCKLHYNNQRNAAIVIQRKYKSYVIMKYHRDQFSIVKSAAIIIQRYYRSYALSKAVRQEYLKKRQLVIFIQKLFRCNKMIKEQKHKKLINDSVIKIQKWLRSIWLTRKTRNKYLLLKITVIRIQILYRNKLMMKADQKRFEMLKKSCIFVQRCYRNKKNTRMIRSNFLQMKHAAIILQNQYRANQLMKYERNKYLLLKQKTIFVQRWFRNKIFGRETKLTFENIKTACVLIQRKYRAYKEMQNAREKYLKYKNSALLIQRYYKSYCLMKIERKVLLLQKQSAVTIQKFYRGRIQMKKDRSHFLRMLQAIIKIQKFYRSYTSTQRIKYDYQKMKNAAIVIQRFYRNQKIVCMQRCIYLKTLESVRFLQIKYRAKLSARKCRKDYLQKKNSVITIQKAYRSYLLMKVERQKYLDLIQNIITVQRLYRNKLLAKNERKQFLNKKGSALKIQSYYKMHICQKKYLEMKRSAIVIQKYYRSFTLMKKIRTEYWHMKSCTILLQKTIRKWLARKRYLALRHSIILIQRKYKLILKKKEDEKRYLAAVKIQASWRTYNLRQKYLQLRKSVVFCQNQRRANLQMRETRENYQKLYTCIIKSQAAVRGYLCRRRIAAERLHVQNMSKLRLEIKAAIKIQAYLRGYNIRKKQDKSSLISILRHRWQKGALQSSQPTLAERNRDALDVLCHFNDVASVIRAFKTLDFITGVYPMIYSGDIAKSISTRLILYMGAANRSVSTLETLQLGTAVLMNLTRYRPTAHFVYSTECVNTIITLMLRWCGKDNVLSCSFCTLLWLFGKYDDIKKDLKVFLHNPNSYKILCKVRTAIIREQRMNLNKRHSYSQTPIKVNSKNTAIIQNLPMTEPDFGIRRTTRPKIFQDEVNAINSVFYKFELPLNNQ